jgi:hypothetical protein
VHKRVQGNSNSSLAHELYIFGSAQCRLSDDHNVTENINTEVEVSALHLLRDNQQYAHAAVKALELSARCKCMAIRSHVNAWRFFLMAADFFATHAKRHFPADYQAPSKIARQIELARGKAGDERRKRLAVRIGRLMRTGDRRNTQEL